MQLAITNSVVAQRMVSQTGGGYLTIEPGIEYAVDRTVRHAILSVAYGTGGGRDGG